MRFALALALLISLVAAPGTAWGSAPARLIAEGPVDNLQAGGGWVSWAKSGSQVMYHDGESMVSHAPFVRPLGTDASGRAVGLLPGCDDERCVVRHLLLPEGALSTLFTTDRNMSGIDEYRGTFLVGFRRRGHPKGIYLRRRGEHSLRRLTKMLPEGQLSISAHAMTNLRAFQDLFAASRERPHRWRRIAFSSDPYLARGTDGATFVDYAQAEGRYVYWLEEHVDNFDNGKPETRTTRIVRVDPGASHRHVEQFNPRAPHDMGSMAVTGGNLYFTDSSTGDLYEVRHPSYFRSADPVPVR